MPPSVPTCRDVGRTRSRAPAVNSQVGSYFLCSTHPSLTRWLRYALARDLLYKYFGQLELLELRFPEIRVNFPWRDAFTTKLTTQTSIAFEKASVIFQIAATHSLIASQQSRSDPEGLKRAFYYLRSCAGMLQYINDNFLHAPSTDLSREVVKFLTNTIQAQAIEVFLEKCKSEKKGDALVSKIAAQVAHMYTSLSEEVKEFMGKGIFERNWVILLQVSGHLLRLWRIS
jgi:hypothetical protein